MRNLPGSSIRVGLMIAISLTTVVAVPQAKNDATAAQKYSWHKPSWVPTPIVPIDNPMSEAKVELGRRLFYDKQLSSDRSMSCGTCHVQALGFTDGRITHVGVTGQVGIRNAMPLTNVAYFPSYTWANPGITTLERQTLVPLFSDHPIEMGMMGHDPQLIADLQKTNSYREAFEAAFPGDDNAVSLQNMVKAIAAFERTLLSFNSPYDRFKQGDGSAISPSAKKGEALFFGERLECYHCHGGLNFTDNHAQAGQAFPESRFHNTGLYNEDGFGAYKKIDHGLRDITGIEDDEGSFRTPSLRNVAVTAPYMHDGSLGTLEEVIQAHYAVKGHAALSQNGPSPLRSEFIEGFKISKGEVKDLVAFLNSLTDDEFLHNPALSDPNASRVTVEKRRRHVASR